MDDPAEDIMGATYRALCDRGYADLTMRDIAEQSDRSKAALHYHYDDKEGLLVAFLDHLFEQFVARVGPYALAEPPVAARETADDTEAASAVPEDPDERLRAFVAAVLESPREGDAREFRTAMLEIKAQVPYQEAFREGIAQFDDYVEETVTDLVVAGQDAGIYRESVDPEHVASFVLTVFDGAGTRHVVAEAPVECAIGALEDYLDAHLVAPERAASATDGCDRTEGGDR